MVAAEHVQALLHAGDLDAEQLAAVMRESRHRRRPADAPVGVLSVLTVDVVGGRIQTVRIVRNPDKLAHL